MKGQDFEIKDLIENFTSNKGKVARFMEVYREAVVRCEGVAIGEGGGNETAERQIKLYDSVTIRKRVNSVKLQ